MSQVCEIHNVAMNWRPPGVSKKTNRPYQGFWACPEKTHDGNFCNWRPAKPTTPAGQFNNDLNRSAAQNDNQTREAIITRTAIAKSMIERGTTLTSANMLQVLKEAETWVAYCNGKGNDMLQSMANASMSGVAQESRLPDVTGGYSPASNAPMPKAPMAYDTSQDSPDQIRLEDIPF